MCGIAGLWLSDESGATVYAKQIDAMCASIAHRGPDARNVWVSSCGEVGLGHQRLAIVDLSAAGNQPMTSRDGRFTLIYNGEIYNHDDLRVRISRIWPDHRWNGHSDTETLLAAISLWGLKQALCRAFGMFALALWDNERRTLSLARDRVGEKPLCYWHRPGRLAFASELRAIQTLSDAPTELNPAALRGVVETGAVPDDCAILAEVRKVPPGTIVSFEDCNQPPQTVTYECFTDLVQLGLINYGSGSTSDDKQIEDVLQEVVQSQLIGDVPIGSFLSGGIDSSLITALMCKNSSATVRSFAIGFSNLGYDESRYAEAIAEHLGTEHVTYRLREEDALAAIPELAKAWDEPFADSSQLPTLLLCQRARAEVTVALTGDGGDEVFGGYNRHVAAPRIWRRLRRVPRGVRSVLPALARVVRLVGGSELGLSRALVRRAGLPASVLDRASRIAMIAANAEEFKDIYSLLLRQTENAEDILRPRLPPRSPLPWLDGLFQLSPEEWTMLQDSLGYLRSDILPKVDRAAMSVSLETRAPFLDRRTIVAAWSLPLSARICDGRGKQVLRRILRRHVHERLFDRPKQGFSIPLDTWLRGPLAAWVENTLAPERLSEAGLLNNATVQDIWRTHKSGRSNHGALIWSLLMLQNWVETTSARRSLGEAAPLFE